MTIFLIFVTVLLVSIALYQKHFLAALATGLFGLYELLAPIFYVFDEVNFFEQSMYRYVLVASDQALQVHLELIGTFLFFCVFSYLALPKLIERFFEMRFENVLATSTQFSKQTSFRQYYVLLGALAVFGLISVYQGAGQQRLQDYLGYEYSVTPFYSYGTLLLVFTAPLLAYAYKSANWGKLWLVALCALPICTQIFISSRRQFLAPLLVFGALYILYQRGTARRHVWLLMLAILGIALLGLQAQMRIWITGVDYTDTDVAVPVAVQVAEFVAISTTSVSSIVHVDPSHFTHFAHFFVFGVCNMIPYFKLGEVLFPESAYYFQRILETIAPVGGLSMIAEGYMSAGYLGVALIATITGVILYFGHLLWRHYVNFGNMLSPTLLIGCSLICLLLLKYRSGFTDAFLSSTNFILLFVACLAPLLLARGNQRQVRAPVSTALTRHR